MTLRGKLIELPGSTEMRRKLGFESISYSYSKPERTKHVWQLASWRVGGMSWKGITEAIGREAELREGHVFCYLGDGVRFDGTLADGGQTKAISVETKPVPCPKVRAGTETRWHVDHWEKLLRKGWVPA